MDNSPFRIRGAIEGLYGAFYTFPERKNLIRFLGRNGFNFYLYGPKNDRQHRTRWWDPYPLSVLQDFEKTIRVARDAGVNFCYAISFGTPTDYASEQSFEVVTTKFNEFYKRGCRSFAVLVDDLIEGFPHQVSPADCRSLADAHANFCNRLYDWAQTLAEPCPIYVCPSEYSGTAPFSEYLHHLGAMLHPAIDLFYTGPAVCSRQIAITDVESFAAAARRPPLIWDNYPVNDLTMKPELHIGPLLGRDPFLHTVAKGFLANVMAQAEASKIALLTIAEYLQNPGRYDPDAAWKRALLHVAGRGSFEPLERFAENSLRSCLQNEEAPLMDHLVREAITALEASEAVSESLAVTELATYLTTLDESCYQLKNRMRNLWLREDLLPWIEALEDRIWLARRALLVVQAVQNQADYQAVLKSMHDGLVEIQRGAHRIGGAAVIGLAAYAQECAAEIDRESTILGGWPAISTADLDTAPDALPFPDRDARGKSPRSYPEYPVGEQSA